MDAEDRMSGAAHGSGGPLQLRQVGAIRSRLTSRRDAPKQGDEGAPDAWLEVLPWAADALLGLAPGDEIIVITWLDRARRDTFQVHPRSDPSRALAGVFATRSPDRPNPLGLHPVVIRAVDGLRLRIGPIEAIDGTPVVDIKPVLLTRDTRPAESGATPTLATRDAMSRCRVALANLKFPSTPDESVTLAKEAIAYAGAAAADIICFPECYVPGYRAPGKNVPPPHAGFLEDAWSAIASAAADARVAVVLGTERIVEDGLCATALVIDRDGTRAGFQDKVQIDPTEEGVYVPGTRRQVFHSGDLVFGVSICHEGWRYPETIRWPARQGAQVVFHPHFHEAEPGSYRPVSFADPLNTFHEKALLCRAAENTCYVASANCASEGSPTTSAVIRPDGTLLGYQPYGQEGVFIADVDLSVATRLLARRLKPVEP